MASDPSNWRGDHLGGVLIGEMPGLAGFFDRLVHENSQ
jgi:hypothetical protein